MDDTNSIFTIEIPVNNNIKDWCKTAESKDIVFPELLIGCELMLYDETEKEHCMNVITHENGTMEIIEFVVRVEGVDKILDKILEWALEHEYFETYCVRVRELQTILKMCPKEELVKVESSEY